MNQKKLLSFLLLTVVLLLQSCAVPQVTHYYLLEYIPQPSPSQITHQAWPYRVRIKDFDISEVYRRDQMVYRQSPHELRFYNYELWAVKPEYLISDMLFRHFRDIQMFQSLTRNIEQEEADFILQGEVTALEEYDNENQWYAHLAMAISLQDTRTHEVVWSNTWDYRKKVQQQKTVYVVRELSALLEKVAVEASEQLDKYFSQMKPISIEPTTTNSTATTSTDTSLTTPDSLPPPDLGAP